MIIQRWQSLLLLISCVMMACFSFSSLGQYQLSDYILVFNTWGIYSEGIPTDGASGFSMPTIYLLIISLLSSLLFLIDIFLFKNTRQQKQVLLISLLATVATAATTAVIGYTAIENGTPGWSSIIIAPIIAFVGGLLAYKFIKSDEEKLRSYDRIR